MIPLLCCFARWHIAWIRLAVRQWRWTLTTRENRTVIKTPYTLRRLVVLSLALLLALGGSFTSTLSAAPKTSDGVSVPVTGSTSTGGHFQGTATITRFANNNGALVAVGTLTGVVTDASGAAQSILSTFSAPVNSPSTSAASSAAPAVTVAAASCSILNLTLGPIHLDLLGLVLDTNTIVVNLTAVPGAGNLLGNLLCSVSNLLNGGINGQLNAIVNLLNQILAAL